MFIGDISYKPPASFSSHLQEGVYALLDSLNVNFERVDTEKAVKMEDCAAIDAKLGLSIVKTLFLCNAQRTQFCLFVTRGNKSFHSKASSKALGMSRLSFAPREEYETRLKVEIGAATIFTKMLDPADKIRLAIDGDVLMDEFFGCSDGTTTSYLKLRTEIVMRKILPAIGCVPTIVDIKET